MEPANKNKLAKHSKDSSTLYQVNAIPVHNTVSPVDPVTSSISPFLKIVPIFHNSKTVTNVNLIVTLAY